MKHHEIRVNKNEFSWCYFHTAFKRVLQMLM